jgi:hypothetical protein
MSIKCEEVCIDLQPELPNADGEGTLLSSMKKPAPITRDTEVTLTVGDKSHKTTAGHLRDSIDVAKEELKNAEKEQRASAERVDEIRKRAESKKKK